MIRSCFYKYVEAKVRKGIKYYVMLRCSVSKPCPFIGLGILIRLLWNNWCYNRVCDQKGSQSDHRSGPTLEQNSSIAFAGTVN